MRGERGWERMTGMTHRYARALGILVGLSLGQWIGKWTWDRVITLEPPRLINWAQARELAIRFSGAVRLTNSERQEATARYRALVEDLAPAIAEFVQAPIPLGIQRVYAFDRIDWIDANLEGFAELLRPLEEAASLPAHPLPRLASLVWAYASRSAATIEVGVALGFLSRRVLGQYDTTLLGREPVTTGKLYFIEPNVRWLIRTWRLPEWDFRRWLVLHEVTHAFEFETYPWLGDHINRLLRQWVETLRQEGPIGKRLFEALQSARRDKDRLESSWFELLMSPEQRRLFRTLQSIMAVVEGYSDFVMRQLGRSLVSHFDVIEHRLAERERLRTPAEQILLRLTGLDLKLEQYRRGEAFCKAIYERYGLTMLHKLWEGPEMLPTFEELAEPEAWVRRLQRKMLT